MLQKDHQSKYFAKIPEKKNFFPGISGVTNRGAKLLRDSKSQIEVHL